MEIESKNSFIKSIATTIIQSNYIDPFGNDLVNYLGIGIERNNQEAIVNWIRNSLYQMTTQSGSLISVLNQNLNDEISSLHY